MVSGSWDGSARLWGVGKWECNAVLEGHDGSVWTVLAYDRKTIITGGLSRQDAISTGRLTRVTDRLRGQSYKSLRYKGQVLARHQG